MAAHRHGDLWSTTRRILFALTCLVLLGLFVLWRIDSPRIAQMRMALIERITPNMAFITGPLARAWRMIEDFESYTHVYEQNRELRAELQKMRGWQVAARQLEQQNARLRELNHVRLSPRVTWVAGEVLSDSGSPFSQSAVINIGARDGVVAGAAAMDGLGLVGRVAGLGNGTARLLFVTDASSRIAVRVRPSGTRAIVAGDNSIAPVLEFVEDIEDVRPGDRVLTSGEGGVLPPDLLVGEVVLSPQGRLRVRPAADYRRLRYLRVLRPQPHDEIPTSDELLGPFLPGDDPFGASR